MAEAHKFTTLADAEQVFPGLPWKASASGNTWIYDSKLEEYVSVSKGQFIYKVGDRFEVRDSEELPKTTKPATDADETPVEKAVSAKEEKTAKTTKSEKSE